MSVADGSGVDDGPGRPRRWSPARVRHSDALSFAAVDESGFRAELDALLVRASGTALGVPGPRGREHPLRRRPLRRSPTPCPGRWPGEPARRYRLVHRTEYTYDDEVTSSFGLAHLLPRVTDHQRPLAATLEIDPSPAELREHTDFFGNRATYVQVESPHRRLVVTASSEVEVDDRPAVDLAGAHRAVGGRARPTRLGATTRPPWRPGRSSCPRRSCRPGRRSPTSRPSRSHPAGRSAPRSADLVAGSTTEFEYSPGATTVSTTLPEVLRRATRGLPGLRPSRGRCAALGRPARRATSAATWRPRRRPAGPGWSVPTPRTPGSRRTCRRSGWVELDPTNDQLVDERYVVAAHGRDYADVTADQGRDLHRQHREHAAGQVDLTRC